MSSADWSQFHIPCLCGAEVCSHERETRCPACGRWLAVEWGKTTEQAETGERNASER